jgi:flagellar assembly protein FliH
LSDAGSPLLSQDDYVVGQNPYLLKQMTQAALAELRRKASLAGAEAQVAKPAKPADPEVLKARAEALDLKLQAEKILKAARLEASRILEKAQAEAQEKTQEARLKGQAEGLAGGKEEGLAQGRRQGEEEGRKQWKALVDRWQSILDQTIKDKGAYLADREQVIVRLAIEIASKVLAQHVKTEPDSVLNLVRHAIHKATDRSRLSIHLNPEDINKALLADESSFRLAEGVKQIEFLADEKVMPGGVLIETPSGTIDARIETQLEEVNKSLSDVAYHGE